MFLIRATVCAFFTSLSFICYPVQAMDGLPVVRVVGQQQPRALLNQVGQDIKDFMDSQADFTKDRVEYYTDHLEKLKIYKNRNSKLASVSNELEIYYNNNLRINQNNHQSATQYQQHVAKYFNQKMEDVWFLRKPGNRFSTFLSHNGCEAEVQWLEQARRQIVLQLQHVDLSDFTLVNNIIYDFYKYFGLQEKADDFAKVVFLSDLFSMYLDSCTSFLVSRQFTRDRGENCPSTKSEDWALLDDFDRAKVETSCTNFANFLQPLGLVYRALQQLSNGKDPLYLFNEEAVNILSISPTLQMYLQGMNVDVLDHPDVFIEETKQIIKLDLPVVVQVREMVSKNVVSSQSTVQPVVSRQQRRQLQKKKRNKEGGQDAKKVQPTAQKHVKTSSLKPEGILIKSQPLPVESKKEAGNDSLISSAQTIVIPTPVPVILPLITEPVPSSSTNDQQTISTTQVSELKPKRWRGDIVIRKKTEGKKLQMIQVMDDVSKVDNRQNSTICTTTSVSEMEGSCLKVTDLINNCKLTKNDLLVIDLLLDNKTHPHTITRKHFLHLLENLNIKCTPTSGSIYSLTYVNLSGESTTKVMHIWDTLGRNMMKRSRFVLKHFGFLTEYNGPRKMDRKMV